ncbi:MAG: response regulator transcription factor [Gemmatimonadota bacterium]|nr:response regulator transcription factor [Gemmatimonadota bacterium]
MVLHTLPVRVLVADDSESFRTALSSLLEHASFMTVVAAARDGSEAVRACRKHEPDLVMMDVRMPIMNGCDAAVAIREMLPDARIILLSVDPDALGADAAAARAIDAFIPKIGLQRALRPELERLFPLLLGARVPHAWWFT